MRIATDLKSLSSASRWLLLTTLFVSSALFTLTPYLVVGVSRTTSMGVGAVSASLLVAMVLGNVAGLGLAVRAARSSGRWLVLCCGGLTAAPLLLVLAGHQAGVAAVVLVTGAFVLLRSSFAVYFTVSKSIHLSSNVGRVPTSTVFTLVGGTFAVGTALGPVLGVALVGVLDYDGLYVGAALLFLLAGVVTRCAPVNPADADGDPGTMSARESFGQIGRRPSIVAVLVGAFLLHVLLAQTFSYLPLVFYADHGNGQAVTATFFTVHAVLMVALPVAVIGLVERWLLASTVRFAVGTVLVAGSLSLLGLGHDSWGAFAAGIVAISLGELLATANSMELLRRSAPSVQALTGAVALYTFVCSGLGLGTGQFVGTALFENVSRPVSGMVWVGVGLVSAVLGIWGGTPRLGVPTAGGAGCSGTTVDRVDDRTAAGTSGEGLT